MLQSDITLPLPQDWQRNIALPMPSTNNGGGSQFPALARQNQDDIESFIRHGDDGSSAVPAMTPEAWHAINSGTNTLTPVAPVSESDSHDINSFISAIAPYAQQTAAKLGIPPENIMAHAALESGWGQHPLKHADGSNSYNLFGIKAGSQWHGPTVQSLTTEHIAGNNVKIHDQFRAYPDYQAAFNDYAALLQRNPRFQPALNSSNDAHAFGLALSRAGYSTDPAYASKLSSIARKLQGINPP